MDRQFIKYNYIENVLIQSTLGPTRVEGECTGSSVMRVREISLLVKTMGLGHLQILLQILVH
jgi:hypothetical protein